MSRPKLHPASACTCLTALDLDGNRLTRLTLPLELTNLGSVLLRGNQLREFILPAGLSRLSFLALDGNQLTQFTFPAGLTNLSSVGLTGNQLTNLTLPSDLTQLNSSFVDGNPFTSLVLSESLAATNLAGTVTFLLNQGISVFTYPLAVRLISPRRTGAAAFEFALIGPPGIYTVLGSADLAAWSELGTATNQLGSAAFTHLAALLSPQKFYRARSAP